MWKKIALTLALVLGMAAQANAHFGVVVPSDETVMDKNKAEISLDVAFIHPMEQAGMNMEKPALFAVIKDGKQEVLTDKLQQKKMLGKEAWGGKYKIKQPGVYQFVMEPKPYWEPAEDVFIVHYTKTYVAAFGEEEGWDEPAGLKTEIVPMTRPFANYAGNVFQGQVLAYGKPVPNAEVEIEYLNNGGKYEAPNDYFVTQVVKADANGVFTYAVPFAGWWGFAALTEGKDKMMFEGKEKNVELGAVLWTRFTAPKKAK